MDVHVGVAQHDAGVGVAGVLVDELPEARCVQPLVLPISHKAKGNQKQSIEAIEARGNTHLAVHEVDVRHLFSCKIEVSGVNTWRWLLTADQP